MVLKFPPAEANENIVAELVKNFSSGKTLSSRAMELITKENKMAF